MTLHQMKIFEAIARHLNITEASEELHTSQPAVSQQVKLLENELGVKFLARISHGVQLTREGSEFLEAILPVLASIENIEKRFRTDRNAGNVITLMVGGSSSVSVSLLPQMLAIFRTTHPEVKYVIESNDSRTMERRILDSELEIAVITNPSYSSSIAYELYECHEVVAFATPGYPLLGRTVTLRELGESSLVLRTGSSTANELVRLGVAPNLAVRCEAADAVRAAVYRGIGVGILHRETVEHDVAAGLLEILHVPELEKLEVYSYIIYDRRKRLLPIAQEFLHLLRESKRPTVVRLDRPLEATAPLIRSRRPRAIN